MSEEPYVLSEKDKVRLLVEDMAMLKKQLLSHHQALTYILKAFADMATADEKEGRIII